MPLILEAEDCKDHDVEVRKKKVIYEETGISAVILIGDICNL